MLAKRLLAAAVAATALAAPAAASADSIVYLDQGNVWSAEPDGSRKVQLTDGGDWFSVTQADDGTIAAARNLGSIEVLARDGRPLRSIATQTARTGNGGAHRGTPINLAFSPDGRTIAYEYFDVTCPPASTCPSEQHSVLYTSADGPQATPHGVHGQQFGRSDPSFVTNGRALVFGGSGSQVNLDDLGGGDSSDTLWFNGSTDFDDGELSRDGTRIAVSFGSGADTRIGFLRVNGDPRTGIPAQPTAEDSVCETTPDAKQGGASWSPDGSALAYHTSKGIEIVRLRSFVPGGCDVAGESILTPTGTEPDWGPADPPAARFTPAPTGPGTSSGGGSGTGAGTAGGAGGGGTAGGGGRPATPGPAVQPPAPTVLRVTGGQPSLQRFRTGTLRVTCAAPRATACAAQARVKVGRRTYRARGTAPMTGGRATVTVRFGRAATKAIRTALRRRTLIARLELRATGPAGAAGTVTRGVRLRR
jgi:uncharacterized membrane protein YgcG